MSYRTFPNPYDYFSLKHRLQDSNRVQKDSIEKKKKLLIQKKIEVDLYPDDEEAWRGLANTLIENGDLDEAVNVLKQAKFLDVKTTNHMLSMSLGYLNSNNYQYAYQILNLMQHKISKTSQYYIQITLLLAKTCILLEDYKQSVLYINEVEALKQTTSLELEDAFREKASLFLSLKYYEKLPAIMKLWYNMVKGLQSEHILHLSNAWVASSLEIESIQQVNKCSPYPILSNDQREAIEFRMSIHEQLEKKLVLYYIRYLLHHGENDLALSYSQKSLDVFIDDPYLKHLHCLCLLHSKSSTIDECIVLFKNFVESNPLNKTLRDLFGQFCMSQNHYREASDCFDYLCSVSSKNPSYFYLRILCLCSEVDLRTVELKRAIKDLNLYHRELMLSLFWKGVAQIKLKHDPLPYFERALARTNKSNSTFIKKAIEYASVA
mmetsp:Transcript_895/g.1402  ORF Transcript_895/g.1402 Transcript_895/m.1402 type:complete len:435 (-) Transcript_895:1064-2368(-)